MPDNNAGQAPQAQSNGDVMADNKKPAQLKLVLGVIGIIAVAGIILLLGGAFGKALNGNAATSIATTSIQQGGTTVSVNNTSSTQILNGGGGPGQTYMSENEMVSLVGTGGKYSAIYVLHPGTNYTGSGILNNNITALWHATYSIYGGNTIRLMLETVYQSPKANYLYAAELKGILNITSTSGLVVTTVNVTSGGLEYSAIKFKGNSPGFDMLGYKGNDLVFVIAPYETNQTAMASTISTDIP